MIKEHLGNNFVRFLNFINKTQKTRYKSIEYELLLRNNFKKISVSLQRQIKQYAHRPIVSIDKAVNRLAVQIPNRGTIKVAIVDVIYL